MNDFEAANATRDSSDAIFLRTSDGTFTRAPSAGYLREAELQSLIAAHPDLLGADQVDDADPPRWLLIAREVGIPDGEDASDRWSIDHLFLDHRGVPTFVEVKRGSDTRIRREVVGQMLDYAANASSYWPAQRIREIAIERAGGTDSLDRQVRELLSLGDEDDEGQLEQFWTIVDDNLRAGRLRLLFVADEIPGELRRIIEFLNEHMPSVEVLGVELRRYQGDGVEALVPRVVGQTERARAVRTPAAPRRRTTEREFLELLDPDVREFFTDLLSHARKEGLSISWGQKGFGVRGERSTGEGVTLLFGYPPGAVGREVAVIEVYLKQLHGGDQPDAVRAGLLACDAYTERGQYTVGAEVRSAQLAAIAAQLSVVWETYRRLRAVGAEVLRLQGEN